MRKAAKIVSTAVSVAALLGSMTLMPATASAAEHKAMSNVEQGKMIAFNKKLGNCLACHQIAGGNMAGNIGPALKNMKARYPDKAALRARIWDETKFNPNTVMPPFGRNHILTESQIDKVVDFIYTL